MGNNMDHMNVLYVEKGKDIDHMNVLYMVKGNGSYECIVYENRKGY